VVSRAEFFAVVDFPNGDDAYSRRRVGAGADDSPDVAGDYSGAVDLRRVSDACLIPYRRAKDWS
jgi:hypothetical protein